MKDTWYDEWWEKYNVDRPRWHTDEDAEGDLGGSRETDCWCGLEGSGGEAVDLRHLGIDGRGPESQRMSELECDIKLIHIELRELLLRKHADYGPSNILNSPGGPLNGLSVRLYDKVARLNNLLDIGTPPQNESLRDTLLDIANYATIGLLVVDENWGK
jgi:hypothetical protein